MYSIVFPLGAPLAWCVQNLVGLMVMFVFGGCGDLVTFVSHYPIRFFLSYRAMVFRLEPSMIDFSSICLTSTCSGNTFSQYMIWSPNNDSRAMAWFSFFQFPSGPSGVIGFASALSATSTSFCSPD